MPWKPQSVEDQKLSFVAAWIRDAEPKTVLCARYGISRQTGYEWWRRYCGEGPAGLAERSRAPHRHGRAMAAEAAVRLIELRRRKPYWGPKKLLAVLQEADPGLGWPSASAVSELLRREGLSEPQRRKRRPLMAEQPFVQVEAPNDAWCIDFKGWFRTCDGERCDPLTVTDAHSRYLLALEIVEPVTEAVEPVMDALFRRHGLPGSIRSDNGPPFASSGAGGLTRLSARWARLGIRLERIEPGKPQQNGRHERMHRTLKHETCKPPCADAAAQQARFDAFRQEYNEERPHEALDQTQPARLYRDSSKAFAGELPELRYAPDEVVRRVRTSGEIHWSNGFVYVSEALVGETIAIRRRDDGHYIARYAEIPLLMIDGRTGKPTRFGPGRPPRPEAR